MTHVTDSNLTALVQESFSGLPDDRTRELLGSLVAHLHAFARETRLTHAEWRNGLAFLHEASAISDANRSEFSLMSDVFGLSSLVDLLNTAPPPATPGSVLGPFHARGSPVMDSPANLLAGNAGQAIVFHGKVTDTAGRPIEGAMLDFWQNADNGLYWQQDSSQPQDNLRCQLRVEAGGRFEIATVQPKPYTIPTDGPVGALFQRAGRSPWRPAHLHVIVEAAGYRTLVTEVFESADPYLKTDAVFGVRDALVVQPQPGNDPATCRRYGVESFLSMPLDIVLERA